MGCGQSKINIYPRKSKSKNSSKKGSAHRNDANSNNEHASDQHVSSNDADSNDASEDACFWKSTDNSIDSSGKNQKPKTPQIGGPLEISESQLNFFRMLDEKIESGPDYDSNSETEVIKENERLNSLLHDWETASAASRSLPSTPQRQRIVQSHHPQQLQLRSSSQSTPNQVQQKTHPHMQQNIHQTYGMGTKMSTHQTIHNPTFQSHSPSHQPLLNSHIQVVGLSKVMPGIQYQDGLSQSPPIKPPLQNFVPQRTHHLNMLQQREAASRQFQKFTGYGSSPIGSPIHTNVTTHIPHNNLGTYSPPMTNNSPTHFKNHSQPPSFRQNDNNPAFTNGELMLQQQIYNQQLQYQQSREFQQYKQTREQMLLQQQQIVVQAQNVPQPQYPVVNKQQNRINHSGNANFQQPQFQTSVEIPIRAGVNRQVPNADNVSPKLVYRKQNNRQYTQELT